jgi:hypothetical protein
MVDMIGDPEGPDRTESVAQEKVKPWAPKERIPLGDGIVRRVYADGSFTDVSVNNKPGGAFLSWGIEA